MTFLDPLKKLCKKIKASHVIALVVIAVVVYFILISNNVVENPLPNTPANTLEGFEDGSCPQVTNATELSPANDEIIVAMFYADWCGYCKKLKPKFLEICNTRIITINAERTDGKVSLKLVDCVAQEAIGKKYGITGYPTLKIFKKSNAAEHPLGKTYTGNTEDVDVLTNNLTRISL